MADSTSGGGTGGTKVPRGRVRGSMWDFDAPMYVDFSRIAQLEAVHDDDNIDDLSYFSVDHEAVRASSFGRLAADMRAATEPRARSLPLFDPPTRPKDPPCQPLNHPPSNEPNPSGSKKNMGLVVEGRNVLKAGGKNVSKAGEPKACRGNLDAVVCASVPPPLGFGELGPSGQIEDSGETSAFVSVHARITKPVNAGLNEGLSLTECDKENESDGAMGGAGAEPAAMGAERGRQRFVDVVTSAKKRLSMSVDRGHNKLTQIRHALLAAGLREGEAEQREGAEPPPNLGPTSGKKRPSGLIAPKPVHYGRIGPHPPKSPHAPKSRRAILGSLENISTAGVGPAADPRGTVGPKEGAGGIAGSREGAKGGRRAAGRSLACNNGAIAETSVEFSTEAGGDFVREMKRNEQHTTALQPHGAPGIHGAATATVPLVPHTGVPFQVQGWHPGPKSTAVKPFSFEERERRLAERRGAAKQRQAQAEELRSAAAHKFHAQPFPDIIYAPANGGHRTTADLTQNGPQANHMPVDKSLASNRATEKGGFKARPPTVLSKAPFVPHKSDKAPTEVLRSFASSQARRAEQRAEQEHARLERQSREASERVQRERLRAEAEEAERRRMRELTVHRAQPVRHRGGAVASGGAGAQAGAAAQGGATGEVK